MSRLGKIARLPREIREELNRRLDRNLPGPALAEWLNGLPGVEEMLRGSFKGKPISVQNLSEWRHGGFSEWQTRHEILDHLRDTAETADDLDQIPPHMADRAARFLSARIAVTLNHWNGDPHDPAFARLKHLSALVRDITRLRRGDNTSRLQMEQYAFDLACRDRETADALNAPSVPRPPSRHDSRRPGPVPSTRHDPDGILAVIAALTGDPGLAENDRPGEPPATPASPTLETGNPPGASIKIQQNQTNLFSRHQDFNPSVVSPPHPAHPSWIVTKKPELERPALCLVLPFHPGNAQSFPGVPALVPIPIRPGTSCAGLRQIAAASPSAWRTG